MTLAQLRALAVAVGFADPNVAAAVAMAESGGDPCARGDPDIGPDCTDPATASSFGLWQIHVPAHPEYSAPALFDPTTNARAALAISRSGADWSPWSTFTSGAYAKYLPQPAPVALPTSAIVLGAALGAAFGAVMYQSEGPHGYAHRVQRAARRRGTAFFHPAAQWALVGAAAGWLFGPKT